MDGRLYSAPMIRAGIGENESGPVRITGSFTEEEAKILAAKINEVIGSR
jgi:hypothetical protein